MKTVAIMNDKESLREIDKVCRICWPEMKVLSTSFGKRGAKITDKELPDIIFLDLSLPDISGFEVLKQIRQRSHSPIIVVSGTNSSEDITMAFELGADEFILKPIYQPELVAHVRTLTSKVK